MTLPDWRCNKLLKLWNIHRTTQIQTGAESLELKNWDKKRTLSIENLNFLYGLKYFILVFKYSYASGTVFWGFYIFPDNGHIDIDIISMHVNVYCLTTEVLLFQRRPLWSEPRICKRTERIATGNISRMAFLLLLCVFFLFFFFVSVWCFSSCVLATWCGHVHHFPTPCCAPRIWLFIRVHSCLGL